MTATIVLDHVRAYADAVRAELADLPSEQVEDLTDGLEANLAEALAETGAAADADAGSTVLDPARVFGPARAYAAELRAAAGLGLPADGVRTGRLVTGAGQGRAALAELRQGFRAWGRAVVAPVTSSRYWSGISGFLRSLAPVWWVVRAWVWYAAVLGVARYLGTGPDQVYVPTHLVTVLLLGGLVVLSVHHGRGLVGGVPRRLLRAAGVVAAVVVVPLVAALWTDVAGRWAAGDGGVAYVEVPPGDGVYVDGVAVSNLYVYDAHGRPLEDVQVFDDRGLPVQTLTDGSDHWYLSGVDEPWRFGPAEDADGRVRWNVYPLRGEPVDEWGHDEPWDEPLAPGTGGRPPLPFAAAPPLVGAEAPTDTPAEDTVPEDVVPEDAVPEDAVPEDAVPEDVVPEDVVPDASSPTVTADDASGTIEE